MPHTTVIADGSFDFSGGVNSDVVTTVRSQLVPHGLRRDQLAWMSNCQVRGGAITPRGGWLKVFDMLPAGLWQGGIIFLPPVDNDPYLICSISGHIYKAFFTGGITDLSAKFGLFNPPTVAQAFFAAGNGFCVIQAGDGITLPLFYNPYFGDSMRRSNGLTGNIAGPNISELPAAFAMVFYQGRFWYSAGRQYTAGDIEGSSASGTAAFQFLDSCLRVTENPLAFGGDGFIVPSDAGNIRALTYTANLDTALGQGPLYILTRKQVYSLQVPVTRTNWIAANSSNQPQQTVVQINGGTAGEDGIVHVNGDFLYEGLEPSVRSFAVATRWYGQWGNVPISNEENRILQFTNRALAKRSSGVNFDNRALLGALPKQTNSGIVTPALMPLDFDTISTLSEREPPAWEGHWEGLDILKMFEGDFGGRHRAFAVVVSRLDGSLDMFELSDNARFDADETDDSKRISWYAEFPAFTWAQEFELKHLLGGEIWIDRVFGTVQLHVDYRPDAQSCWLPWYVTSFCSARNCEEDVNNPCGYPLNVQDLGEGYRFPIVLPEPRAECAPGMRRPSTLGYQFQPRLRLHGFCRIRGIILYAEIKAKSLYDGLVC